MEKVLEFCSNNSWQLVISLGLIVVLVVVIIYAKNKKLPQIASKWFSVKTQNDVDLQTIYSIVQPLQSLFNGENLEKIATREKCLEDQLEFTSNKFELDRIDVINLLEKRSESKNTNDLLLSRMLLLSNYDKFEKKVDSIVRKNHLAEKSEEKLNEEIETQVKLHLNYVSNETKNFPIKLDTDIFLEDYERIVKKTAICSLSNAKKLSEKKEKAINEISKKYSEKRKQIIKSQLNGKYSEEDINKYIDQLQL